MPLDIDIYKARNGISLLEKVCSWGSVELLDCLLKDDRFDFNQKDEKGNFHLGIAVTKKKNNIVARLLESSVDINATDKFGRTALILAVEKQNSGAIKKLLKAGADATLRDCFGRTALDLALIFKFVDIILLFPKELRFGNWPEKHAYPKRHAYIKADASNELHTKEAPSLLKTNISMMVLGGFIAAVGITAVAIAFTVLNAATLGLAGVAVAGIGVVASLTGLGLFAKTALEYLDNHMAPARPFMV